MTSSILVFGGNGTIGKAVLARFATLNWRLTATSRHAMAKHELGAHWIVCDPETHEPMNLDAGSPFDAVCWAQGANTSDSVFDVNAAVHLDLYRANCVFVLETLQLLLSQNLLGPAARMVVVSSIWQQFARQNKLSYMMSKAALGGLVRSAAVDLATRGFLINAVLPSAIDSPMTRKNLDGAQIERLEGSTGFGRLTMLDDVVSTIEFLCSARNTGITGQSIKVDLGMSQGRLV